MRLLRRATSCRARCGRRYGPCWPVVRRCWAGRCSAAPTGMLSGSGPTPVGTGGAPHVPGCRSSAGGTHSGHACWPATTTRCCSPCPVHGMTSGRPTSPCVTPRLCAGVRDPVRALRGAEADLGATPGLRATRHTWTQTRLLHPHGHCLVTGGGLTESGDWVAVRHGLLLPSRVAMAVFRGTRRAAVRRAVPQGQRRRPAGLRPQRCDHRLQQAGAPAVERAHPGALSARCGGAPLPGARWAWWATREPRGWCHADRGRSASGIG